MWDLSCRTCLKFDEDMQSLFTSTSVNNIEVDYATMVMVCSSVQVEPDDEFPKNICLDCLKNLESAFSFKLICEESQSKLLNYKDIPSPDSIVTFDDVKEVHPLDLVETEHLKNSNEVILDDVIDVVTEDPDVDTVMFVCRDEDVLLINKDDNAVDDNREYSCEECSETFTLLEEYTWHLAKHWKVYDLDDKKKVYMCQLCDKVFKNLHGLQYHIKMHKGIKQYQCDYRNCKWSFIAKQSLEKHILTHTNIKTFLCNICGKSYTTKDSLAHHIKTHSGKRPFKCTHCDKTYLQSSHLKKHILVHFGSKPHVCELCGRAYTTSSLLKRHFTKFCGAGIKPVFRFRKCETVRNNL